MKIDIKFVGYIPDEDWPHYLWNVTVNGTIFTYKTGLGLATKQVANLVGIYNRPPKEIAYRTCNETKAYVHVPNIDDILNALFDDAAAGEDSFDGFCNNLGYSNDSLKALDTYRACAEISKNLRNALKGEYETERERITKLREEGKL